MLPKTLFPFIWHFLKKHKLIVMICASLSVAAGFWGPFNSMLIKKLINLLPGVENGDVSVLVLPASLVVINFICQITMRSICTPPPLRAISSAI